MNYYVKIEGTDGNALEFGQTSAGATDQEKEKNVIRSINIKFDTVDDNVSTRKDALLAKVCIKGTIDDTTMDRLKDVFKWALDTDKNKVYKDVKITVIDQDQELRHYIFKKMFVVDYVENLITDGQEEKMGDSIFELYLTQQENNLKTIDTY